jgi:hypothetical protein
MFHYHLPPQISAPFQCIDNSPRGDRLEGSRVIMVMTSSGHAESEICYITISKEMNESIQETSQGDEECPRGRDTGISTPGGSFQSTDPVLCSYQRELLRELDLGP